MLPRDNDDSEDDDDSSTGLPEDDDDNIDFREIDYANIPICGADCSQIPSACAEISTMVQPGGCASDCSWPQMEQLYGAYGCGSSLNDLALFPQCSQDCMEFPGE